MRRSALICQIDHKQATDRDRLFDFCLRRAGEAEFFIRKAIGWALRQYSHVAPLAVALEELSRLNPRGERGELVAEAFHEALDQHLTA